MLLAEGWSPGPAQYLPTSGRGLPSSRLWACPKGQSLLRVQRDPAGKESNQKDLPDTTFQTSMGLGDPPEFLPAPHLSGCHSLPLSSLLSLTFNSPSTIFIDAPWLLWKPKAANEVEFGGVLRFPGQHLPFCFDLPFVQVYWGPFIITSENGVGVSFKQYSRELDVVAGTYNPNIQ